jgi:hypothetical protein
MIHYLNVRGCSPAANAYTATADDDGTRAGAPQVNGSLTAFNLQRVVEAASATRKKRPEGWRRGNSMAPTPFNEGGTDPGHTARPRVSVGVVKRLSMNVR